MSDIDTGASTPNLSAQTEPEKPNPVKEMRAAIDTKNAELKAALEQKAALETRLQEIERSKLDEVERLRLEVNELKPLRDEHGRFTSLLERLYQQEIQAVPEEKRAQVERLSATGDWATRLEAVRAAKDLLPAPLQAAGTVTNPGSRANPAGTTETPKLDPKRAASDYFANHAKVTTANLPQQATDLKNYQ